MTASVYSSCDWSTANAEPWRRIDILYCCIEEREEIRPMRPGLEKEGRSCLKSYSWKAESVVEVD